MNNPTVDKTITLLNKLNEVAKKSMGIGVVELKFLDYAALKLVLRGVMNIKTDC